MAPKRELLQMFAAIGTEDLVGARRAATAIAELEARHGHHAMAAQLRGSLATQRPTAVQGSLTPYAAEPERGLTPNALTAIHAPTPLRDVAMPKRTRSVFEHLLREFRAHEQLRAAGLEPRRRVLIHGPPGCGKSMVARALATELDLPIFVVRLDAVVGAYLGQTASRLRELFRFVETMNAVVLFDEVDALGRARGDGRDIGELDRIAISLMQELEHAEPRGLLIATSNLAAAMDKALVRRFDVVVEFKRPTPSELQRLAVTEASRRNLRLDAGTLRAIRGAGSYAQAVRIVTDMQREAVLRRVAK
jgi:SpoVK/Ycf46/Vps4 family AAA+-type ATPase